MGKELNHTSDRSVRRSIGITNCEKAEEALRDANENPRMQTRHLRALNEVLQLYQTELEVAYENLRTREEELQTRTEALRDSEKRYHALFETAPDAIIMHRDNRFLDANEAALRLVGAGTVPELANHTVLDFFRPQEREQTAARIRLAMTGRRLPVREAMLLRLDGQEVAVEFHTSSVDFQGAPAVQTIIRDITERKRAEETLRELNVTLESQVAQRTAELEHRTSQLQGLTLELSQADEQERRRLAVLLHEDLPQRIAAARFYLNSLSNQAESDSARQGDAAEVNQLLRDVIGMSRNLSRALSPAVFYGNDLGEAVEWLAEHMEAQHGLRVQVEAGGRTTLESESRTILLFRATRELLSNVVRHAGISAARVRLRRIGRYVGLCVSDRGRGFDLPKLQDTPGFGLFGIRTHVELVGGRMTIRTTRGKGSMFRLVVPDDVDSRAEDHVGDETRYRLLTKEQAAVARQI